MNRKLAREYAYKLIFGYVFTKEKDEETMLQFASDANLSLEDKAYLVDKYEGVIANFDELKQVIAKYAVGFEINRIFKPDLAVLLLAIYEMKFDESIPLGVSISEAVTIVKIYSTTKSNSFVNGILASVYKEVNAERLAKNVENVEVESIQQELQ